MLFCAVKTQRIAVFRADAGRRGHDDGDDVLLRGGRVCDASVAVQQSAQQPVRGHEQDQLERQHNHADDEEQSPDRGDRGACAGKRRRR